MTPIEELRKQKQKNKDTIEELAVSIGVWMGTAQPKDVLERVENTREYVAYRMLELEVQGQKEKIEHMRDILKLVRHDTNGN